MAIEPLYKGFKKSDDGGIYRDYFDKKDAVSRQRRFRSSGLESGKITKIDGGYRLKI